MTITEYNRLVRLEESRFGVEKRKHEKIMNGLDAELYRIQKTCQHEFGKVESYMGEVWHTCLICKKTEDCEWDGKPSDW